MECESPFWVRCQPVVLKSFSSICIECQFDRAHYHDNLFRQFGITFPEVLRRAVDKRKAEFLAGRYAARQAMYAMELPVSDIPIGLHRSPVWPAGVSGSISHSGNRAFCLLSTASQYVGVDFEFHLSRDMAESIKGTIINAAEEALCREGAVSFEERLTLVFSAKESLFKVLYPQVKRYFDFLDAEVVNVNAQSQRLELRLLKTLAEGARVGKRFVCRYVPTGDGLLTYIELNQCISK